MRALLLFVFGALLAVAACAPRQNKTHFERWDEYAAAHPPEEEEATEEAPADMKKTAPATTTARPAPPPPAPPSDYSSLGGNTPAIGRTRTSTPARVVKPEEPEDEPIY